MGAKKDLDNHLPRLVYFLTILLFALPLIPRGARPLLLLLYSITTISSGIIHKESFKWKMFILNSVLFLSYALSLIYTEDIAYGFRKIGTCIPLILFPLIFSSMSKKCVDYVLERRYKLMWVYISATGSRNIFSYMNNRLHVDPLIIFKLLIF